MSQDLLAGSSHLVKNFEFREGWFGKGYKKQFMAIVVQLHF
jgi:hypothetical protein